jgi:hypothetical protein
MGKLLAALYFPVVGLFMEMMMYTEYTGYTFTHREALRKQ